MFFGVNKKDIERSAIIIMKALNKREETQGSWGTLTSDE